MLRLWYSAVDKGILVRIAIVSFAKAFNHATTNIVNVKLVALGLPDIINHWIDSFLCHWCSCVKVGIVLSDRVEVGACMPRG